MKVDFHVHSTASDGTFAPSELAAKADEGGFLAMALTDHDNTDGVAELMAAAKDHAGVKFVTGTELSIDPGETFHKFHLLALGIDPGNAAFNAFLKRILDGRNDRNARIVANFNRIGIPMQYGTGVEREDIALYAHGDVLARPHFARWLMVHGYAPSIVAAFEKYLLPESPKATRCYEERFHPGQEETFRLVHDAGGICVMAHPKYWRRYWKDSGVEFDAAERGLAALKEKGLDALECHYQADTVDEDVRFTRIAEKLGYLKSAGSDFHGENKPTIPLGMEVSESFIGPLLERLGKSFIR